MLVQAPVSSNYPASGRTPEEAPQAIRALLEYFRCPANTVALEMAGLLSENAGFFRFGKDTICYGRCVGAWPTRALEDVPDVIRDLRIDGDLLLWPFDFSEVVDNLRYERYRATARGSFEKLIDGGVPRRI